MTTETTFTHVGAEGDTSVPTTAPSQPTKPPPTTGRLLTIHAQLKAAKALLQERVKEATAKLERIENELLKRMQEDETDRLSGAGFTAYQTTRKHVQMRDKATFLAWAYKEAHLDMIGSNLAKTAVVEYLEKERRLPPGVGLTQVVEVNVRKQ